MARSRLQSVVKADLEQCEIYMDFAKNKVRQRCLLMANSTVGQGKHCSHCKLCPKLPGTRAQSPTGPPGEPSTDTKVRLNTNPRCPAMAIATKQHGKSALLLTSTALQVPRQSPGSELGNKSFTAFQESVQLHSPPAS